MIKDIKRLLIKYIVKKIYPYFQELRKEEAQTTLDNLLCNDNITIGDNVIIHGVPLISVDKTSKLEICDGTTIVSDDIINHSSGFAKSYFVICDNAIMRIGKNVGISNSTFTVRKEIIIEDDVAIGSGCMISDNDFHSVRLKERMSLPDPNIKTKPIYIKRGAFIGARTIILKGVTIGEEAVIGAGSVVTCDIPTKEIWAGNPAVYKGKI